jgi:ABC-type dipeptide/oligopeptide/nickel transport system ATPase component
MPRKINFDKLEAKYPAMPRPQSRYLTRVSTICGLIGATGSGKSVMAVSLLEMMRREKSITRVFVISPTANSNHILNAICPDPARDWKIELTSKVFDDLKRIEEACEGDADAYYRDMEYAIAKKKYVEGDDLSQKEESLLEERGYVDVVPKRPSPALFLDDCQSSPIFSNSTKNVFTNLVLRSRHVGQGIGLSIFLAAQTSRGIPRGLRLNFTHLFIYRTQSLRETKILYEEVGALINESEFTRLLNLYTLEPYGYMFVDLWAKRIANTF